MKNILSIERFKFNIGGFYSTKFEFILHQNVVSFYSYEFDKGTKLKQVVSSESLDLFIFKMNELNIVNWDNKFDNNDVQDGEQWGVEIKYNNTKKKVIYGNNEYPGSRPDSIGRTTEFNEFLEVIKLVIQDPSVTF